MKVKVTEEKLYPIFKKFMETYFKKYEWRKDEIGIIWFVDPEGYGHLGYSGKNYLTIYRYIIDQILRYIPMEESMLELLMGRWVGETLQIEDIKSVVDPLPIPVRVGDTFPL